MEGKEIKGRTRLTCPLCGALRWQSQFEKENPLYRAFTQWSPAFRQFRYAEIKEAGFLSNVYAYFIQKVEELYERLTGINIQQLLSGAGGEKEWQKSKSVLIQHAPNISIAKMEQPLYKRNLRVIPASNVAKSTIETSILSLEEQQKPCSHPMKFSKTQRLVKS